jgi:hypothetical protein
VVPHGKYGRAILPKLFGGALDDLQILPTRFSSLS